MTVPSVKIASKPGVKLSRSSRELDFADSYRGTPITDAIRGQLSQCNGLLQQEVASAKGQCEQDSLHGKFVWFLAMSKITYGDDLQQGHFFSIIHHSAPHLQNLANILITMVPFRTKCSSW